MSKAEEKQEDAFRIERCRACGFSGDGVWMMHDLVCHGEGVMVNDNRCRLARSPEPAAATKPA